MPVDIDSFFLARMFISLELARAQPGVSPISTPSPPCSTQVHCIEVPEPQLFRFFSLFLSYFDSGVAIELKFSLSKSQGLCGFTVERDVSGCMEEASLRCLPGCSQQPGQCKCHQWLLMIGNSVLSGKSWAEVTVILVALRRSRSNSQLACIFYQLIPSARRSQEQYKEGASLECLANALN